MSKTNDIPSNVYQWASGHYLVRPIPDNWLHMDEDVLDAFMEENVCEMYEYWDANDLWKEIEHLAYDAYNFFKGVK